MEGSIRRQGSQQHHRSRRREGGKGTRQRAGAKRWSFKGELRADGGLKKSAGLLACCCWIDEQGYPARLGISEMSPMNWADSGMSKHNTESTQTSCLAERRPCCHSSSGLVCLEAAAVHAAFIAASACLLAPVPPFYSAGQLQHDTVSRRLSEAVLVIAPSNRQRQSGTLRRGWPWRVQRVHR